MNISFIGLGKLGLPLACLLAKNNKVLFVDKNEFVLDKLNRKELPFFEPGLEDLFNQSSDNIIGITSSYNRVVQDTDAVIILVNTQLGDSGYASDFVESAARDIALNLRDRDSYFTIILSSTVLPGTINNKLIPMIESVSGKKYKDGFGFTYVPDFVKLGSVVIDFQSPEFFLVGSNYDIDYTITKKIFKGLHVNDCKEFKTTMEEAEVAKVALNSYIVNKICFANFLGILCEGLENVNVHNITNVIGNDRRISPFFFKSGTPYGGTCFPRDTKAFIKFSEDRGFESKGMKYCEEINSIVMDSIVSLVPQEHKKIGILGLSFKPNSPVLAGSPSVLLAKTLSLLNKEVYCFDRLESSYNDCPKYINTCSSPQQCIDKVDTVIIMHPDKYFSKLEYKDTIVIDKWGIIQ